MNFGRPSLLARWLKRRPGDALVGIQGRIDTARQDPFEALSEGCYFIIGHRARKIAFQSRETFGIGAKRAQLFEHWWWHRLPAVVQQDCADLGHHVETQPMIDAPQL